MESIHFKGVRFNNTAGASGFIQCGAIDVIHEDCIFGGQVLPTLNRSCTLVRCTVEREIELDKQCELVVFRDCHLNGGIRCQSASIEKLVFDGTEIHGLGLRGTVQHTVIRDSYLKSLSVGPTAFGIAESLTIENSRINAVTWTDIDGGIDFLRSAYTYAAGVFTKNRAPVQWAIPGANMMISGNSGQWWPHPFKVTDVTYDVGGDDVLIHTTAPDPFPVFTSSDPSYMVEHVCPSVTVTNSVGCADIVNLSQAPNGSPFGSYMRMLMFKDAVGAGTNVNCRGYLKELRINVIRAYTGAGALSLKFSQFDNIPTVDEANVNTTYGGTVNAKIAGERIITPGSVGGIQSLDSLPTLNEGYWFRKNLQPTYSADFGAETLEKWPIVEIEAIMSHGIVDVTNLVVP